MIRLDKLAKALIIPLVILLLAGYLLFSGYLSFLPVSVLNYFVLTIFIIAMLLSIWFNKSRYFFALLYLAVIYIIRFYFIEYYMAGLNIEPLYWILTILLTTAIITFSFTKDQGVFSLGGGLSFLFIVFQTVAIIFLALYGSGVLAYFNANVVDSISIFQMPNFQCLILILGSIFYLASGNLWPQKDMAGFLGVLAATLLPFYFEDNLLAWETFYSASAIIILLKVLNEMHKMAYIDELTGLPGRRSLHHNINGLSGLYTIAMVDIDHFKKINDRYGHEVGDQVLKFIASMLKNVTGGGRAYRYGGEEFILIFAGFTKKEVWIHLEALRIIIEERPFHIRQKDRPRKRKEDNIDYNEETGGNVGVPSVKKKPAEAINVTVSIGVADNAGRNIDPRVIIEEADKAMYQAKNAGRNRVSLQS